MGVASAHLIPVVSAACYSIEMKTRIIDNLKPEDVAMLQALYSRSAESVDTHIGKVEQSGSGKFMERYYVGYGHKSIADCGSTTIFIEGVSLLAAKAVQDWPLYSGQETSTRYIDMSQQAIIDPIGTSGSKAILNRWMDFYTGAKADVEKTVRERHPYQHGDDPTGDRTAYDRAVQARAFDILRGFLPAGITTQLSWHTNLRQASDHLEWMKHHPVPEMSQLAVVLREQLASHYPSSGFSRSLAMVSGVVEADPARDARQDWEWRVANSWTYSAGRSGALAGSQLTLNALSIGPYMSLLRTRPKGCVLPHFMSDLMTLAYEFDLDFGSFRDLQRHRNGVIRMPMLTTKLGFETWYLHQLDDDTRQEALTLLAQQEGAIARLEAPPHIAQYYTALGYCVECQVSFGLPAFLYVVELRSGKTVHPTLRSRVLGMATRFAREWPDIAMHVDRDPDDWTIRRGQQTIVEK